VKDIQIRDGLYGWDRNNGIADRDSGADPKEEEDSVVRAGRHSLRWNRFAECSGGTKT